MSTDLVPLTDTMTLGKVLAQSGFFTDARTEAQAVVKVLAGRELGFGPVASMTGIYIVKGKPSLSANLMAAAVKRSGRYNYRVRDMTPALCRIEFFERQGDKWESVGVSEFTAEDARKAETQNMSKFPRNMLFARAMSNGVRWFCPDVTGGPVYTPEELGEPVDEDGEIVTVTVIQPEQPKPGNGHAPEPKPEANGWHDVEAGSSPVTWKSWKSPAQAVAWGVAQGCFEHPNHANNAYDALKKEINPTTAAQMFEAWQKDVERRCAEKQQPEPELFDDAQEA